MKVCCFLIGAEQGNANAPAAPVDTDTPMASSPPEGSGGEGNTSALTGAAAPPNNNSTGLMALSDEDSVEPQTYGMVTTTNNSSHSIPLGFKQEPLMDTDPRYA